MVHASRSRRPSSAVAALLAVFALGAACWGPPDDARPDARADSLAAAFPDSGDPREQLPRFRRLSIPDRLRVYNSRYDHSGHPRDLSFAFEGFADRPAETFAAVVADLPEGNFSRFLRYMSIIYVVGQARGYDACRAPEFPVLQARVRSYRLSPEQRAALTPFQFRRCTLDFNADSTSGSRGSPRRTSAEPAQRPKGTLGAASVRRLPNESLQPTGEPPKRAARARLSDRPQLNFGVIRQRGIDDRSRHTSSVDSLVG